MTDERDERNDRWDENEPLAGGLDRLPCDILGTPASPAFRDALLRRTASIVRARAWRRTALRAASILIAYAAGIGTMLLAHGGERGGPGESRPSDLASAQPIENPAPAPEAFPPAGFDPGELSGAPPDERKALLKKAGDYYLTEFGDVKTALRYYREHLEGGSPRGFDPDDSWLLRFLKHARETEAKNERVHG